MATYTGLDGVSGNPFAIVEGGLALRGDISPASLSVDQNDFNPAGLLNSTRLRLTSSVAVNITGLAGGDDGRQLILINVGSNDITLVNESASSAAANRFAIAENFVMSAAEGVLILYDSTSSRWRALTRVEPVGGGLANVVEDTTPQLGGNLDMQANLLVGNGGSTGIAISANGAATMAAQPAVLAFNSAADADVTGNNTLVTVDLDTEVYDQNGDFAIDTFTAPVTGRYLAVGNVELAGITGIPVFLESCLVASNRTFRYRVEPGSVTNGIWDLLISITLDMDAADTLILRTVVNGVGADTVDINGDGTLLVTYLSVVLLV